MSVGACSVVDHPGAWEKPAHSYLSNALTRKVGTRAVLAIILQDVLRTLLVRGTIDFLARVDLSSSLPTPVVVPGMTRQHALSADGAVLNTCSASLLAEVLTDLKRAFWPFAWDFGVDHPARGGLGSAVRLLRCRAPQPYPVSGDACRRSITAVRVALRAGGLSSRGGERAGRSRRRHCRGPLSLRQVPARAGRVYVD